MLTNNAVKDYSGGATNWQGKDLGIKGSDAYKKYYEKDGITFKNPDDNLWSLKNNSKKHDYSYKTTTGKVYLTTTATNKWISTGTAGKTTFFKRTEDSLVRSPITKRMPPPNSLNAAIKPQKEWAKSIPNSFICCPR